MTGSRARTRYVELLRHVTESGVGPSMDNTEMELPDPDTLFIGYGAVYDDRVQVVVDGKKMVLPNKGFFCRYGYSKTAAAKMRHCLQMMNQGNVLWVDLMGTQLDRRILTVPPHRFTMMKQDGTFDEPTTTVDHRSLHKEWGVFGDPRRPYVPTDKQQTGLFYNMMSKYAIRDEKSYSSNESEYVPRLLAAWIPEACTARFLSCIRSTLALDVQYRSGGDKDEKFRSAREFAVSNENARRMPGRERTGKVLEIRPINDQTQDKLVELLQFFVDFPWRDVFMCNQLSRQSAGQIIARVVRMHFKDKGPRVVDEEYTPAIPKYLTSEAGQASFWTKDWTVLNAIYLTTWRKIAYDFQMLEQDIDRIISDKLARRLEDAVQSVIATQSTDSPTLIDIGRNMQSYGSKNVKAAIVDATHGAADAAFELVLIDELGETLAAHVMDRMAKANLERLRVYSDREMLREAMARIIAARYYDRGYIPVEFRIMLSQAQGQVEAEPLWFEKRDLDPLNPDETPQLWGIEPPYMPNRSSGWRS